MQRVLSASKDCYITNKIINNRFRATDANVGQAGTLDLFKLYNESTLQTTPSNATATVVVFAAGSSSYSGKSLILVDSVGKTVTLLGASSNARTTEGSGTFASGAGVSAVTISENIVAAFNAVKSGDTKKIDMTISSASGSGIIVFRQTSAGSSGNTVVTGTSLSSSLIRDANSAEVSSVSFSGGSQITKRNYENSRLLIKFDLSNIKSMHQDGLIDVGEPSFKAELKLHDVYGGQTTPSNFDAIVFPLAQKFDEGSGFDIVEFKDLGSSNWLTASVDSATANLWNLPGGNKSGSLGDSDIDIIVSGTFPGNASAITLCSQQYFQTGEEDLRLDVTNFVSASIKNLIDNHGFLVAFSGSYENDTNSYFVKRFASRNTANTSIRPKMIIKYDDSIIDNHGNFIFDYSGSLYLNNFSRTGLSNIKNAADNDLSPTGAMILKIRSGSFSHNTSVSQVPRGSGRVTGLYSASFLLPSYNSLVKAALKDSTDNQVTFDAIWSSPDETITYLSSSLKVKKNTRTSLVNQERRLLASTLNLKDRYDITDVVRIRLFIENANREVVFSKGPLEKPSEIFENVHYSVRDFVSGDIIIPYDTTHKSTRLSTDSEGMYYDFYMSNLPRGRAYVFEYLVIQSGFNTYIKDAASKFVVE